MNYVIQYTREILTPLISKRALETKYGETISLLQQGERIETTKQKYVLVGIPEDVGVRANYGIAGTAGAWEAFLGAFLNIQHTANHQGQDVLLLGEIDCKMEMEAASQLDPQEPAYYQQLGVLVERIDSKVSETITTLIKAGKVPIIIGGGHNNCYGNLKGAAIAMGNPINCINFDAHSDFRPLEHRHSGNGFSFAMEHQFLNNYYMYGLHTHYLSQDMIAAFSKEPNRIKHTTFERLKIFKTTKKTQVFKSIEAFICTAPYGLEIDLDAIAMMGSSAISPSGFTVEECREFVAHFTANNNCKYIHLCEGAPARELHPNQVAKTLSYLVTNILYKP